MTQFIQLHYSGKCTMLHLRVSHTALRGSPVTVFFALATSLLWGVADFGGGVLTRRFPALTVVVVSQAAAAAVLGAIVAATGAWAEAGPRLWFAVAAGAIGPVAMLCFYRALALGPMGVVS